MPTGPQGQKRPNDPIACAVHVRRIAISEIEDTKAEPPTKARKVKPAEQPLAEQNTDS